MVMEGIIFALPVSLLIIVSDHGMTMMRLTPSKNAKSVKDQKSVKETDQIRQIL